MKMGWAIILAASVGFGVPVSPGLPRPRQSMEPARKAYQYASLLWSGPRGLLHHEVPAKFSDGIIAVRYGYDHQPNARPDVKRI